MPVEVNVPDIGDFKDVPVITVLVKVGDTIAAEDPLIELESDKATMEVPSPVAGRIASIVVKEGDRVSEGSVILTVEAEGSDAAAAASAPTSAPAAAPAASVPAAAESNAKPRTFIRPDIVAQAYDIERFQRGDINVANVVDQAFDSFPIGRSPSFDLRWAFVQLKYWTLGSAVGSVEIRNQRRSGHTGQQR